MPLYLGLDSSTQSLSAIVLEMDADHRRVVFEDSLSFDERFPRVRHGPRRHQGADPAVAVSSPLMWVEALDAMMARVASARRRRSARGDFRVGAAARQRLPERRRRRGARLPSIPGGRSSIRSSRCCRVRSRQSGWTRAPAPSAATIAAAVGGDARLAQHTGSRAFERFTGPQIRKFATHEPGRVRRDRSDSPRQLVPGIRSSPGATRRSIQATARG